MPRPVGYTHIFQLREIVISNGEELQILLSFQIFNDRYLIIEENQVLDLSQTIKAFDPTDVVK